MALRGYCKPVECTCTDSFTCGHCMRNAKPWLWDYSKVTSFSEANERWLRAHQPKE